MIISTCIFGFLRFLVGHTHTTTFRKQCDLFNKDADSLINDTEKIERMLVPWREVHQHISEFKITSEDIF